MLILIFVIGIILLIIGEKTNREDMGLVGLAISGLSAVLILVLLFMFPYNIDERIELYETENQAIETKIKETVRTYMNYEQKTYTNLVENSDLTTILVAYPELNSNELVKSEIEIYKENNNKLKLLKEEKLFKPTIAFWLYFGK